MLPILLENEAVKKIQTGLDYDPTEIEIALRDTFISVDTELHKLMKNYRRFAGKIYELDSQSESELEAIICKPIGTPFLMAIIMLETKVGNTPIHKRKLYVRFGILPS